MIKAILQIIFLLTYMLNITSLYEFTDDITYSVKSQSLTVYNDNNRNGMIYNDFEEIKVYFGMKHSKFYCYPVEISDVNIPIINNITFVDYYFPPRKIYYNHKLLMNNKWYYDNVAKNLHLINLNQSLFDDCVIEFVKHY